MISITGEMRDLVDGALANGTPCFVGTASRDGRPQISMKGSVLVYDEETLAFWERAKRTALQNVNENAQIVIFYRNPAERFSWRFHGTATVHESGAVRDAVMGRTVQPELDRDPDRQGVAVLVKIDLIDELSGKVLQRRD
jgi:predicted pyridoxine 5'-phosphate oxidase superfamily flavin-nucleotide-binding protein